MDVSMCPDVTISVCYMHIIFWPCFVVAIYLQEFSLPQLKDSTTSSSPELLANLGNWMLDWRWTVWTLLQYTTKQGHKLALPMRWPWSWRRETESLPRSGEEGPLRSQIKADSQPSLASLSSLSEWIQRWRFMSRGWQKWRRSHLWQLYRTVEQSN